MREVLTIRSGMRVFEIGRGPGAAETVRFTSP